MDINISDECFVFTLRTSKTTLKLEAAGLSERLVPINKITSRRFLKHQYLDIHLLEDFKFHNSCISLEQINFGESLPLLISELLSTHFQRLEHRKLNIHLTCGSETLPLAPKESYGLNFRKRCWEYLDLKDRKWQDDRGCVMRGYMLWVLQQILLRELKIKHISLKVTIKIETYTNSRWDYDDGYWNGPLQDRVWGRAVNSCYAG
jgi:hypothetical protein